MTIEAWLTLLVTAVTLYALIREIGPPDVIFVGAVVALALMRVITPEQAFSGFANSGVLLVAALFIVAAALRETGVMDFVGHRLLGRIHAEVPALLCIAGLLFVKSFFLTNTPIVAMMLPYAVATGVTWTLLLLVWYLSGLPFGPQ